jgi:hypothetical protein
VQKQCPEKSIAEIKAETKDLRKRTAANKKEIEKVKLEIAEYKRKTKGWIDAAGGKMESIEVVAAANFLQQHLGPFLKRVADDSVKKDGT